MKNDAFEMQTTYGGLHATPDLVGRLDDLFGRVVAAVRARPGAHRCRVAATPTDETVRVESDSPWPTIYVLPGDEEPRRHTRLWRPPLEFVAEPDRTWLREHGLSDGSVAACLPERYDARRGWKDATRTEVRALIGGLRWVEYTLRFSTAPAAA